MFSLSPQDVVIVAAKRTPVGSFGGSLKDISAPQLGASAINALFADAGFDPTQVDEVYMGQVLSAGSGQAPARQAALGAGLSEATPCTTISKVCGSGMKAVMLAADQIRLGNTQVCVAGGMESMSRAPYLLPKARMGYRLGHGEVLDHMFLDGLQDAYEGELMGHFADRNAIADDISREQMDNYTLRSLKHAQAAIDKGYFADETAAIEVRRGKQTITCAHDELPGQARPEKIPDLKPAFGANGRVTAANASSISDGAAALLLCSAAAAEQHQLKPVAVLRGQASHAEAPSRFTYAPIGSMEKLLQKVNWSKDDVDLFEINEAFAMVAISAINGLGLDAKKVNVRGGACALGHPIGASGARIIVTLLHALIQNDKSRGVASLCIGGGEATAIAIERI